MMVSIVACLLAIACVRACGVAVHLELVERILPLLPPRIAEHYDFVRSGAFYPDAFYNCMGQYDVAEDAHWPPFLANGVELIRERRLKGENTARLEAFLIGILSHQVSDVSWHSLGIFEGLLRSMAETEFNGDYDKAHSVLDIGGDFITLSRRVLRESKTTRWEYSSDDIQALLASNGYTDIPTSSIRYCMARGHAAYSAELRVSGVGFRRFARRSPMLFDQLETYFAGGMTDMHEQIEECLPSLLKWIMEGVDTNPWRLCPVFAGSELDHLIPPPVDFDPDKDVTFFENEDDALLGKTPKRRLTTLHPAEANPLDSSSDVAVTTRVKYPHLKRRSTRSHNVGKVLDLLTDIMQQGREKLKPACQGRQMFSTLVQPPPAANLEHEKVSNVIQPSFGSTLLFWDDKLVVGAPSEGRIYLFENEETSFDKLATFFSLKGETKRRGHFAARFGASLAVWKNHLLVGSPGSSQIDIYNSDWEWAGGLKFNGTTTLYGDRGVKLVGEVLAVDSALGTLYVGAPYMDRTEDRLHVFSKSDIVGETDDSDTTGGEAQRDTSSRGYTHSKTDYHHPEDENAAPCDFRLDQLGAVYVIKADTIEKAIASQSYLHLQPQDHILYEGRSHYEQAGTSIAVTPQFVLVGSPGISKVYGFDRNSGKLILTLSGSSFNSEKPSGFGGHLLTGDMEHVIIGSPAGSLEDANGEVSPNQPGVVSIFKHRRAQDVEGANDFEWFGKNGVIVGDNLYVASPHASGGNGQLWRVKLDSAHTEALGSVKDSFASGFGSAIASDGKVLAIGMPNYGLKSGQKRHGAVAIIDLH